MSHHIYHTEAIVLGSRPSGEGDRVLYCYTRALGLVALHAKSIRESRSRLRYTLQLFSHASVDVIRGKYGWKLISATPISSFRELWHKEGHRRIAANHAELTRRLIVGEEQHESLFDDIVHGFQSLAILPEEESLRDAELLLVMRLLEKLGYWGEDAPPVPQTSRIAFVDADLQTIRNNRSAITACVNESLRSSQL